MRTKIATSINKTSVFCLFMHSLHRPAGASSLLVQEARLKQEIATANAAIHSFKAALETEKLVAEEYAEAKAALLPSVVGDLAQLIRLASDEESLYIAEQQKLDSHAASVEKWLSVSVMQRDALRSKVEELRAAVLIAAPSEALEDARAMEQMNALLKEEQNLRNEFATLQEMLARFATRDVVVLH